MSRDIIKCSGLGMFRQLKTRGAKNDVMGQNGKGQEGIWTCVRMVLVLGFLWIYCEIYNKNVISCQSCRHITL